eukprot:18688-Pleurochrysis_carterae.AAC.1
MPTSPPPPVSAPLRSVAHALFPHVPAPQPPSLAQPHVPAPFRSPSAFAYGIKPALAPQPHTLDDLPQFAQPGSSADAAQRHEQLDGLIPALQALGGNQGTVKKDETARRRYWVPLTEFLGIARWRENPTAPDAILQEARLPCKVLHLVLATMRPRRRQDAAPRPASGYNVLRQARRVHLRAGRDMVRAEHLRCAVDGLQQQFVLLHGHEALLPRRKFPTSNALFHRLIASSAMPEATLLRASLLATLCLLYVS